MGLARFQDPGRLWLATAVSHPSGAPLPAAVAVTNRRAVPLGTFGRTARCTSRTISASASVDEERHKTELGVGRQDHAEPGRSTHRRARSGRGRTSDRARHAGSACRHPRTLGTPASPGSLVKLSLLPSGRSRKGVLARLTPPLIRDITDLLPVDRVDRPTRKSLLRMICRGTGSRCVRFSDKTIVFMLEGVAFANLRSPSSCRRASTGLFCNVLLGRSWKSSHRT
jgi:hypothetical protein